ncbi:hypothetical protein ARSEF1564_010215, partial [Beauveria bassiana]
MLREGFLSRYYENMLRLGRSTEQLALIVQHLVHRNPKSRIIEIGAGTGSATSGALGAIGQANAMGMYNAASYHYTDKSAGFFKDAREKFHSWIDLLQFQALDIEYDPAEQGFRDGFFDIVIASLSLHATACMETTMRHVRKLLKPNGKLLLIETTKDQLDVQFAFGMLPGWWFGQEQERQQSPNLSIEMWNRTLKQSGFCDGIDMEVHDCESEELYSLSVILATASKTQDTCNTTESNDHVIIVRPNFEVLAPASCTQKLHNAIKQRLQVGVSTISMEDATSESVSGSDKTVYVFLGEHQRAVIADQAFTEQQFKAIQKMCKDSKAVLWVTRGAAYLVEDPKSSLCVGLLRSLRLEYTEKRLISLDLDSGANTLDSRSVANITKILANILKTDETILGEKQVADYEFVERDAPLSSTLAVTSKNSESSHQSDRPLKMIIGRKGLASSFTWIDLVFEEFDDGGEDIEIFTRAYGLNLRDVVSTLGEIDAGDVGVECAGVITKVGSVAAKQGYQPGDRVAMLLIEGHFGTLARAHWTNVIHIPSWMSFQSAASILVSYSSGALGQAAINVAQDVGATIYATVGSAEKRDMLLEHYAIPQQNIFNSRNTSFAQDVLTATSGRGVDVVLNSLSGSMLQASFDCLASFGRFIE